MGNKTYFDKPTINNNGNLRISVIAVNFKLLVDLTNKLINTRFWNYYF